MSFISNEEIDKILDQHEQTGGMAMIGGKKKTKSSKSKLSSSTQPKKSKKKRKVSEKTKRRGLLISQLMRDHGLTFGEATHYIKENNIQY